MSWVRRLTDGQVVYLCQRLMRQLTKTVDIDVKALRRILENFVRNLPKLVLVLLVVLTGGAALPVLAPSAITDLRVVAATDTSLVLSWTEVPSSLTSVAKYVIRYDSLGGFTDWGAEREVTTGGCGAPVYGSTATGGRTRSCVLGGLQAHHAYDIQLRAFTGTMNLNAVYGPVSNLARGVTAERIGPMLVVRPPMFLDTVAIEAASLDYDFGPRLFPLHGKFPVGDRLASFYDSTGTLTAWGYLLLVKPQ